MRITPATKEAIELFRRGSVAFSEVEAAGMRVDTEALARTTAEVALEIQEKEELLRQDDIFKAQQKWFGQDALLTSRDQLGITLMKEFDVAFSKFKGSKKTRVPVMDDEVLEAVGLPYTQLFRELEQLRKLHGTYLVGIGNEVCEGFVHPVFNLHLVVSYRSSSSDPNFQNIPIRNPLVAKRIRSCFIPRKDHVLVDFDYSAQEVRIMCSLSGDQKLKHDTLEGDMHRDMAAECFMLTEDEVSKAARGTAKGGFVFAEFYGDWYKQVAANLWGSLTKEDLKTKSGKPIIEHLRERGIHKLGSLKFNEEPQDGTFEKHIKGVEDRFWNERFRVCHEFRKRLVAEYKTRGWFRLVTGFTCSGVYRKNQIINYPVQGPAFHCLLWSLIHINAEMKKRRMRGCIVGQIHDSIVADVHKNELEDFIDLCVRISTTDIMREWSWITTPLSIEVEVSDSSWHDKKEYDLTKHLK